MKLIIVLSIISTIYSSKQIIFQNHQHPQSFSLKHAFHHSTKSNYFGRLDLSKFRIESSDTHLFRSVSLPKEELQPNFQHLSSSSFDQSFTNYYKQYTHSYWKHDQVTSEFLNIPNIKDPETVLNLAKLSYDAYVTPEDDDTWYDLLNKYNVSSRFGWDSDGLRGYVFSNSDDSTMIISIKGTSASFFWKDENTGANDKFNDNRLFSCCCAHVDITWRNVCDCHLGNSQCSSSCLEKSLKDENVYYNSALKIFMETSNMYPDAEIWLTGHSLGGALASLIGLTFGAPSVSFESPGDTLPAKRLHLPMPPGLDFSKIPLWHFGHTADPIFMGVCTGRTSSCYYAGYAMESRCHNGLSCVWDTVGQDGWRVDIRTHRLRDVIERVIEKHGVPDCEVEKDCEDCGLWEFVP